MDENKVLLYRISVNSDKRAFGELFKRYHSKLISFALCFLPHFQEAEDVVSEVFIKLLNKRSQLKDIDNFEGYIYYAVKNQCLNHLKKNRRKVPLSSVLDFEDIKTGEYTQPLNQLLTKELRERIADLVEKLPHKRRLVFKMVKDDGLRIGEVAKTLGIAEKTVKKHLELAIRGLRHDIADYISSNGDQAKIVPLKHKANVICLAFMMLGNSTVEFFD
ncbi:RNA polymerase sigma factor [Echinicola soli]|nr:RNA polymerase sigma-70 factor [Echinicola soli]